MSLVDTDPARAQPESKDEAGEPAIKSTESAGLDSPSPAPEDDEDALIPSLGALGEDDAASGVLGLGPDSEEEDEEFIAPDLNLLEAGGGNDLADGEVDVEEETKVAISDSDSDEDYFEGSTRPQKRAKLDNPPLPLAVKAKAKAKPVHKAIKPAVPKASTSVAASSSSTDAKDRDLKKPTIMVQLGGRKSDRPKPWVCDRDGCGRGFARSSDLNRHYKIHDGIRAFKCSFEGCERDFIQKSALDTHERVHTGERPFGCQLCDRAFSDSSSFARHQRIHTGERRWVCEVPGCGRAFARKPTLVKHLASKHPDVPPPARGPPPIASHKSYLKRKQGSEDEDDEIDEDDDESTTDSVPQSRHITKTSTSKPLPANGAGSAPDTANQPAAAPPPPGPPSSTASVPNDVSDVSKKLEAAPEPDEKEAAEEVPNETGLHEKAVGAEEARVEA